MDREQRAKPEGIAEFLFNELRYALRDIRQKVVEEGWFGRIVTPTMPGKPVGTPEPGGLYGDDHQPLRTTQPVAPEYRPSFDEQWAARESPVTSIEPGKEHGIDI